MPSIKLKGPAQPQSQQNATTASQTAALAAPSVASTAAPKLKIKPPQPPVPATEQPSSSVSGISKKQAATRKPAAAASKKRSANDDLAPAAKRIASGAQPVRKPSAILKIKPVTAPYPGISATTPLTAGGINKLKLGGPRRQSTARVKALTTHNVRREIPKRETGVGYDSEDSEREEDPAIQQGLILRMQPGEDADLLRTAIAEGRVGLKEQGGVDVSIRFVTADLRRALVKVKGRMYAAALVDLPCIVESMKSWDKKGWWKVADVCQMLLVLGPVQTEAQIREFPLPREVSKETMQYAHGLTPPMHYVRKRRFRKRVSHRQLENVEEEVERLMKEDYLWEQQHGKITHQEYSLAQWERMQYEPEEQPYDTDADAEGEYVDDTTGYDDGYEETPQEDEVDAAALEAQIAEEMANDHAEEAPAASELMTESPVNIVDPAASFTGTEHPMADDSAAETPAQTPLAETQEPMTQDEQSSDEDEDSDHDDEEDSPEVVDEDAAEKAAVRAQQLEEVADLEREIVAVKAKANAMANQLLKKRELDKLGKLEGDLKMKLSAFGLEGEE
ncbi:hypothetical protein LTR02_013102 [Friedmanniomyces endolithicus]|nr:hypothetical protein LTR94_005498 [Friedmanniomyces endolithicus]KAK0788783.1 hypothetical protein LTR38_011199 [Friedmanniomyces endolithicus]KAK0799255.1 hypothetical protein LTR59_006195 [Friedmanniomyces endolithicus]KAK0814662.1 hypothetical protein LTR75_004174 [Friedmanniomyces endolithicus]KAK0847784.1 hypothetical protein LTR03_006142 [Friedmanniomyces endolithicus]